MSNFRANLQALAQYALNLDACQSNTLEQFSPITQDLKQEYIDALNNEPIINPYGGVIYNPKECGIDDQITMIGKARGDLTNYYNTVRQDGTERRDQFGNITYSPTLTQSNLLEDWAKKFPGLLNDMLYAEQILTNLKFHTNRHIANLVSRLGLFDSYAGAISKLQNNLNPCSYLNDFFGSLLANGDRLLSIIASQLNNLLIQVANQILQPIIDALASVMGTIGRILSMILNELDKLAEAILILARLGIGNLLCFGREDVCKQELYVQIATGAMKEILKKT